MTDIYNRNLVYLQLLNRRLKKFKYIEEHNIDIEPWDLITEDTSYLELEDQDIIKHSDKYKIGDGFDKNETIKLKDFIESNLQYDKFINYNCKYNLFIDQKLFLDQELVPLHKNIKIQYLGIVTYDSINEYIIDDTPIEEEFDEDKRIRLSDVINCTGNDFKVGLSIGSGSIYFFKVVDDIIPEQYIFHYDHLFYKTNYITKLDYYPIENNILYDLEVTDLRKSIYYPSDVLFHDIKYYYDFGASQESLHRYFYLGYDYGDKSWFICMHDEYLEKSYIKVVDIKAAKK
ncbi:hypothetical protein Hokovirus_4_2 [Hokovirus HKV1]|uniref:Uncharacterized protein n=1 Tax=Hokovirus HKV1 TaxID=1977638 RepID=A0A1V0SHA5_9VIRU|nr:hypothetical protein Hokovirus_4_2 [Hokovirus HKV1]